MVNERCIVCSGDHEAVVGLMCQGHFDRMGQMLTDLELEAAVLSAVPSMQQRMDGGHGSLASERAPARLDVLVHTDRRRGTGKSETDDDAHAAGETLPILDVLHSWARIVREERGLTDGGPVTVVSERAVLALHREWIATQPWADECFTDLRQLLSQLRAANGHRAERPFSNCPAIIGGDYCTGNVWIREEIQPVWRRYRDRCAKTWEPAPGAAFCDTCHATWETEADKARLKRMADDQRAQVAREALRPRTEDGQPMLTADELVAKGHVSSASNVRVRAHRAGVVSVDGHYDPRWFTDKASA